MRIITLIFMLLVTDYLVAAQRSQEQDPLQDHLFPPEVIMQHRQQLNLTETQRDKMIKLIEGFQSGIVAVEWQLQDAKQSLVKELDNHPIDQKGVEKVLTELFDKESEVKRRHILLLVQMKNNLTEEQIKNLKLLQTEVRS